MNAELPPEHINTLSLLWLALAVMMGLLGLAASKIFNLRKLLTIKEANLAIQRRAVDEITVNHGIQMAAISVAASANTDDAMADNSIDKESPFYTPAYGDVRTAIRREIFWRTQVEALQRAIPGHDIATVVSAIIATTDTVESAKKYAAISSENTLLRGLLPKLNAPCHYCKLTDISKCALGFPGCNLADDLMCADDEGMRRLLDENRRLKNL